MKITKVIIDKFRMLENIEIPIARKLTAIAGQNCTAKSSILGLIGHVFKFDAAYKTINGRSFTTRYSEIFRFSYPTYDKPKDHKYSLEFENGSSIQALSYDRIETGKPRELRIRVGKSEKDAGNVVHPVIYLGLKRLFPLAQEKRVNLFQRSKLTQEEVHKYNDMHNAILLQMEQITPERVETRTKKFYGVKTAVYDSHGNSAGQDNLGQILTTLFSFERLKNQLGQEYKGGILLIDEIDAALYPAAQEKLIEKLFRLSSDLNLQVIFTTHSLETLAYLKQDKYRYDSGVVYLSKASGRIEVIPDVSLSVIINDLKVIPPQFPNWEKMHVYCEDQEARYFFKKILHSKYKKKISVVPTSLSASIFLALANAKIPEFNRSIIVLDGDQAKNLKRRRPKNVVVLPGQNSPEKVFHTFLHNLPENDKFWQGCGGYTKQVCFRNCPSIGSRDVMKSWFNEQLPCWGRGACKLVSRWIEENRIPVDDFNDQFGAIYNNILSK